MKIVSKKELKSMDKPFSGSLISDDNLRKAVREYIKMDDWDIKLIPNHLVTDKIRKLWKEKQSK
jgi:hypothetical protein